MINEDDQKRLHSLLHSVRSTTSSPLNVSSSFLCSSPVYLTRNNLTSLKTYDYVFYQTSEKYDNQQALWCFFKNEETNEYKQFLYLRNGQYIQTSVLFNDPEIFDGTVIDTEWSPSEKKIELKDIILYRKNPCFSLVYDDRRDALLSFYASYLEHEENEHCIVLKKMYNYHGFVHTYDSSSLLNEFNNLVFVPVSLPLTLNIQRTMFQYQTRILLWVNVVIHNKTKEKIILQIWNNERTELIDFASMEKDEVVVECYEEFINKYNELKNDDDDDDSLYTCLVEYKENTFVPLHVTKDRPCDNLQKIEYLFLMYQDHLTLDEVFGKKT